jgi:hypothetical protein
VSQLERSGDVIDDIRDGGLLTVQQATIIFETTDQTIYRWIGDAARRGRPIGLKQATWLLGTGRMLDYIEKHQGGPHARVKAESQLKKYWPSWSQPLRSSP